MGEGPPPAPPLQGDSLVLWRRERGLRYERALGLCS